MHTRTRTNAPTLQLKSLTPEADMSLHSWRKKLLHAMDSSCSSGCSNTSMAVNTGCVSSSLQCMGMGRCTVESADRPQLHPPCPNAQTQETEAHAGSQDLPCSGPPKQRSMQCSTVPGDPGQHDENLLHNGLHNLECGLVQLVHVQRHLHLLEALQQLVVLKNWKAELRHCRDF